MEITFLGTGGGRYSVVTQKRQTGGMYWTHKDLHLYVDPGPGALVHAHKNNVPLSQLDAVFASHAHIDHVNDLGAIIECLTEGCNVKRGVLIAADSVLNGGVDERGSEIEPAIGSYHQNAVETVHTHDQGEKIVLKHVELEAVALKHTDTACIGFKLHANEKTYGYVADTGPFPELAERYADCDAVVLNVLRKHDKPWPYHLTTENAAEFLNTVQPRTAILQHFGYGITHNLPQEHAWLKNNLSQDTRSKTQVIFAQDNTTYNLEHPSQSVAGQSRLG